jgi:hypothetical protein
MKSSPPIPDILRSVLSTERFSVVTGPIGTIAVVAILPELSPNFGDGLKDQAAA